MAPGRLPVYTGVVVIDFEGKVQFVDPQTPDLPNGMSHLESIIRNELLKKNGTSDPPVLRQQIVNRMSLLLRGTPNDGVEIAAVVTDKSPLWLQTAQQKIVDSIPVAERDFFTSRGLTIQSILRELNEPMMSIPDAAYFRLEREWKRRAKEAAGTGVIRGTIRANADAESKECKATLIVEPVFRILSSNTPGGWILSKDASRMRKIETDESGSFAIENLPKGSYQITIAAPGRPRAERTVHLVSHDSQAELTVDLWGTDTISGKVTDSAGHIIANAKVKAVKRFESPEFAETGRYTTAHLPTELATTNASGDFVFESLYEVAYVFEVSAEGYETATTDTIPVGTSTLLIELKPVGNAGDEPAA